MFSRPTVLALVAAGCVAAAGLGAYVAVRQNAAPAQASPAVLDQAQPAGASEPEAVAETEALVDGPAESPAEAPAPEAKAAPVEPAAGTTSKKIAARTPAPRAEARRAPEAAPQVRGLEAPWPSREAAPEPPAVAVTLGAPAQVGLPVEVEPYDRGPVYEELIVSSDSVLGLQVETSVSTETARIEDPVEARVTRDVMVAGRVAVPAGTRALGTVTAVERGGKIKERARLGVRFHTLVLGDMTRVPIQTDSIYRDGEPPSNESVAKIGGAAVGGAILGAIFGGTKGAVIGGATGAGAGTAAVMSGDRNAATLPAGATVTIRLISPVTIVVER